MEFLLSEDPENAAFWRLVNLTAPYIAGRDCKVKRQNTTAQGNGETSVNLDGIPVVTIAEWQAGPELMATLLHELAHVKLHAQYMKKSNTENEPPGSDTTHKNRPEWETQANEQALEWARYGNANRDLTLPKDAGILLALSEQNIQHREQQND